MRTQKKNKPQKNLYLLWAVKNLLIIWNKAFKINLEKVQDV